MLIKKHLLCKDDGTSCPFVRSPNVGRTLEAEFLIIHFTAGRNAQGSISWFSSPQAKASAHLVIGRDGAITQMVPFNQVAWHAGISQWQGRAGLNQFSIGIELDNAGKLHREGSAWRAWFGGAIPDQEVIEAVHKNETQLAGWHTFTEAQIQSALEVSSLLVGQYELRDVLGHEDVAPGRKVDPGPAFPMNSFRSKVLGREEDELPVLLTTTTLHIRSGPGTEFKAIPGSPLAPNTAVHVLEDKSPWVRVDVIKPAGRIRDMVGWVHSRYLKSV
jgi:N-acetylmuramoyl-L-alanine amidase